MKGWFSWRRFLYENDLKYSWTTNITKQPIISDGSSQSIWIRNPVTHESAVAMNTIGHHDHRIRAPWITVCRVTCVQDGRCVLSVARHTSNEAFSEIERVRKLLHADDQSEEPTTVTNYVIVNVKLINIPTNRQSISFFSIYDKEPHRVLWAGSRATCGRVEISAIPKGMNYYVIFIVHIQFLKATTGRII